MRRPTSPVPFPDRNYASVLRGYRHMEKHAEITIQAGERPQVDEDRERHQAELITARIGSVGVREYIPRPMPDNSPFWELEDSFGKIEAIYDYNVGLVAQDERSEFLPA